MFMVRIRLDVVVKVRRQPRYDHAKLANRPSRKLLRCPRKMVRKYVFQFLKINQFMILGQFLALSYTRTVF